VQLSNMPGTQHEEPGAVAGLFVHPCPASSD